MTAANREEGVKPVTLWRRKLVGPYYPWTPMDSPPSAPEEYERMVGLQPKDLERLTSERDAAVALLEEVADAMYAHHSVSNQEETYVRGAGGVCAACEEYGQKHGAPATYIWKRLEEHRKGRDALKSKGA